MKILHINNYYLLTTLHQKMIEHLSLIEDGNCVFAPTSNRSASVIKIKPNEYAIECFNKNDRLFFDLKQRKIIKAAEKEFDINQFDIIHAYSLFSSGNVAYQLWREHRIPYFVAVRDTDINVFLKYRPYLKWRGIRILKNARCIFFLSEPYKKHVISNVIPDKYSKEIEQKCFIIPNGIDEFWLENRNYDKKSIDPSGIIRIIFVGELSKRKNVTTTLKAIKILREKGYNISFTAVGKVVDDVVLKEVLEAPFAQYVEAQPKEKLINFYRENDIFVMPSITETFGLVYAEALSQGLPVVYSKGQGFDGQFPDGEIGFAVDSKSSTDIAEKIEKCINNYSSIQNKCVDASMRFDWRDIVRMYWKHYSMVKENENINYL